MTTNTESQKQEFIVSVKRVSGQATATATTILTFDPWDIYDGSLAPEVRALAKAVCGSP